MATIQTPQVYNFNLDKNPTLNKFPKMTFVAGDKGSNVLNISLKQNLSPYLLTASGIIVNLFIRKHDGTKSYQSTTDGSITITSTTGGTISIVLVSDSISGVGINNSCEIQVVDINSNTLTFPPFDIIVEENYSNDIASMDSVLPLINALINSETAISNANNAAASANATNNAIKVFEVYDPSNPYLPLNKVSYNGNSYVNIIACTNVAPALESDNANWILMAKRGLAGSHGYASILESTFTATTNNTTHIPHNLPYTLNIDRLEIIGGEYESLLSKQNPINYTENVDTLSIDLVGWSANTGDVFKFKLFKNYNEDTIQSEITQAIVAKSNLDTSNSTANTTKTALDTSISNGQLGTISALNTTNKTSHVAAINEVNNKTGVLTTLNTQNKTNLVSAINENVASLANMAYSVKNFGAKGDGITIDTLAIQSCLDYVESIGGGKVLVPNSLGDYIINNTIFIGSNTTLEFTGKSYFKLISYTSVGTLLFNKPLATNIIIINPLLDGNNVSANGENGISGGNVGIMRVYGGHIKNCVQNPDPSGEYGGGKGIQIEAYNVKDFYATDTFIENCSKAISSVRDMSYVGKITAKFNNIHAKNCGQFSIFKQANGKDILGREHDITVTNFIAENCGNVDGVFVFSRASNCHFINGKVININPVDAIIRGRHNRCTFQNIDVLGNCNAVIDMSTSYFAIDADIQEQNNYDLKVFGTYSYLLKSNAIDTNIAMMGSKIKAYLLNDALIGLVETNSKSQNTIMELMSALGKRIINSTTNIYFIINTFAIAPKLKMEYHTFENFNMGVNCNILKSDSALNVSGIGLTRPARFYGTENTFNHRITPGSVTVLDAVDGSDVLSDFAIDSKTFDVRINGVAALQVRNTVTAPGGDGVQTLGMNIFRWLETHSKNGMVVTTPDGTKRYRISIDNTGTIISTFVS